MHFEKVPSDERIIEKIKEDHDVEFTSKEGETLSIESDSSIKELHAQKAVRAYNMGFDIEDCMTVFEDHKEMRTLDIEEITKRPEEQKGRLIGKNGRTKEIIEELTDTSLCISRNKVSVIGGIGDVSFTCSVIADLLSGTPRRKIYNKLETYKSTKNELDSKENITMKERGGGE